MASFNNFVLLVVLTFTLILVIESVEERGAIPSEEEKKELERQLKAINKPAIKSFKIDLIACTGLRYSHYKSHLIIMILNRPNKLKPKNAPEWIISNNISWKADPLQYLQEGINCPDGTVIVKRITKQDLMHAKRLKAIGYSGPRNFLTERNNTDVTGQIYTATVNFGPSNFYGVKGHLNLWDPQVSQDQISGAFMAVAGGPKERLSSIYVGWMVNPFLYQISQDHVHLYTHWGKDSENSGCYDITCPGFVQVSKNIPVGALLRPVSVYNGTQYEIRLSLYQDLGSGDWWFAYKDENVGYWPASLFMGTGFEKGANYAAWGGQVYSPATEAPPVMGSGHWPKEGLNKAAYVNSIKVIEGLGRVLDPKINRLKARETSSKCYKAMYFHDDKEPWLRTLYYGGPAECMGT